ncbi:hypothetical protein FHG87_023650 [Trinorchestia longiramus]|nr:hypothetical protein FHG87_023650 [Trinorchestia longiramus]
MIPRKGHVYKIIASDADKSDTCRDVLSESFFTDCPCGDIEFGPLTLQRPLASENPFFLDPVTGEITKLSRVALDLGETYYLQATVRPFKTLKEMPSYTMNLTVSVTPALSAVEGDKAESAFLHNHNSDWPNDEMVRNEFL